MLVPARARESGLFSTFKGTHRAWWPFPELLKIMNIIYREAMCPLTHNVCWSTWTIKLFHSVS